MGESPPVQISPPDLVSTTRFMHVSTCSKDLSVRDRHKKGAETLISVCSSVSWVQNQTCITEVGFNKIWKRKKVTYPCSHNLHEKAHPPGRVQALLTDLSVFLISLALKTLQIQTADQSSLVYLALYVKFTGHTPAMAPTFTFPIVVYNQEKLLQTPKFSPFIKATL